MKRVFEMNKVLEIHSRAELVNFLHSIIAESEISSLADKILSHPSGTDFIFVCRQYDPNDPGLGHRQQVIRVFHS